MASAEVMELRNEIAELRGELAHLKAAFGGGNIGAVAEVIRRIIQQVQDQAADITAVTSAEATDAGNIAVLTGNVTALSTAEANDAGNIATLVAHVQTLTTNEQADAASIATLTSQVAALNTWAAGKGGP